ncbi:RecQ family ATP-dependent DNA helicase [Crocinitomicaceae bacterium]|nr:RecQ family ATP-dependent DNA helicase [Crocinitomicaceae bacterium]
MKKSQEILEHFWGYDRFRPFQEEIIDSAIYGHDTMALLPTGGGKSICFQIPGIAREGMSIVVSPLIALMQDQVKSLKSRGINAQAIYSGMSYREIDILLDNAVYGGVDFLYVSPERLQTRLFIERLKKMQVGLLVVDEAHCISEWGHDFRPAYTEIAKVRAIHPETPIIALTASATERVQEDIKIQLVLKHPLVFQGPFARKNISFKVFRTQDKLGRVLDYCKKNQDSTGIVYCQTRKSVKEVTRLLHSHKLSVGIYHGGMKQEDRESMLNDWLNGSRKIMVSTNAFGMGIDKGDVRYVLHFEAPNNIEAYYQEAGRAGRDEKPAETILYYNERDFSKLSEQIETQFPPSKDVKLVFRALFNHLQIAIGSGKEESYHFNMRKLSEQFNIPIQKIYHSLKLLELNGDLQFSESVFHPTKVKFAIGNKDLYGFQIANQRFSPLITLMARSYPGIFDLFFELDETQFTKRLGVSKNELKNQLNQLERMGVCDVSWASSLPSVTLTQERLPDDYIRLKSSIYSNRKKLAFERLKAMENYVLNPVCRSIQLLHYFSQPAGKCGVCDICSLEKNQMTKVENEKALFQYLREPKTIYEVMENLNLDRESSNALLRKLLMAETITIEEGKYVAKK